jgi:transcriptional regulator with XRE-family HTH domain
MATRTLTRKPPKRAASGSKRRASPASLFRSEPEADKPYATGSNAPTTGELKLEVSIGRRVRVLRQRLQLTATDLAAQAALSPGMLSKIENGGTSPSLSTLQALARALNVPMTSFFADFEERRDCSYVRAGQGVLIERRGTKSGHRYELLGHSLSGDIVTLSHHLELGPGAYVLFSDGSSSAHACRKVVTGADKLYPMSPGDALFFDSGAPNGPEELLERPMTYLSIIIYPRS